LGLLPVKLVSLLVIFLRHRQQGGDGRFVADAKREPPAMFGLLTQSGYFLLYHTTTGTDQGDTSIASALDPSPKIAGAS